MLVLSGISKSDIGRGYDEIANRIGQAWELYDACIGLAGDIEGRVLDLGCGGGHLLSRLVSLSRLSLVTVGLDISAVLSARARELNDRALIVRGDAEKLCFADGSFSCVFATELIEHLLEPESALSEIRRVIGPGGKLVMSLPNRDWIRFNKYARTRDLFQPVDDRFYRWREVAELLSATGFRIDAVRGFGLGLPLLSRISRLLAIRIDAFALSLVPLLNRKCKRTIVRCTAV